MKIIRILILLLFCTQWAIGQVAEPKGVEIVFLRYLVTNDKSLEDGIIKQNDGVYSLYCRGVSSKDITEKISHFTKFIQVNPRYGLANVYANRGLAYNELEKYDSAIVDFDKAIVLDKKDPYPHYFKGASLASLEKHDQAIESYTEAISLDNKFVLSYYMRGMSFLNLKKYENALKDFGLVIENNKSFVYMAYLMRGIAFMELEQYSKALEDLKKAKELETGDQKNAEDLMNKVLKRMEKNK